MFTKRETGCVVGVDHHQKMLEKHRSKSLGQSPIGVTWVPQRPFHSQNELSWALLSARRILSSWLANKDNSPKCVCLERSSGKKMPVVCTVQPRCEETRFPELCVCIQNLLHTEEPAWGAPQKPSTNRNYPRLCPCV